ncbi:MAG: GAF domain-containing protein [Spirochaetes bacterium]|nr:GAF domain-containing protein [Spirochaetota bacterium]
MHNTIYKSKNVNLPPSFKGFDIADIVFTEDFSQALTSYSGIIISANEIDGKNIEEIKKSNYPVIIWSGSGKESSIDTDLNAYFHFKTVPDIDVFSQVIKNYIDYLTEKRDKDFFRDRFANQEKLNQELLKIGVALSSERDNDKLLNYIVAKVCEVTKADAGSLYLLEVNKETKKAYLRFKISHNDSNKTDFTEFTMPLVKKSIAGYVAIEGKALKLDDAYLIPDGAEYAFNKKFDMDTSYRTKSMLTVPMKNYKDKVIGVIQLINKKVDRSAVLTDHKSVMENVVPFDKLDEDIILSLASLAAVSLDNNFLYKEVENLFDCLVSASAKAIEQRDPTTGGHSSRVALYTIALAKTISEDKKLVKKYLFEEDVVFSEDYFKGLKYACLLHDFGKVGVREDVLVKAKKLYPGMLEQILLRLDNLASNIKIKTFKAKFMLDNTDSSYEAKVKELDLMEANEISKIEKYRQVIIQANEPTVLESEPEQILAEIKRETKNTILSEKEFEYLSIQRGSLTKSEREEIISHASYTYDFLKNIPWPENIGWIPEVAKGHHETLDGTGYPDGLLMPKFQSRLMAIADIFDALTASDRPYKKAMTLEQALKILQEEAKRGRLDSSLVNVFIEKEVYKAG